MEQQNKLLKDTIVTAKQLSRFIRLTDDEIRSIEKRKAHFPLKIKKRAIQ